MHKLERGDAPKCLKKFKHGRNNWGDVESEDKTQIWAALEAMQGQRCAYCEADIADGKKHIEHFRQRVRQRDRHPQGTFDWANLFGSCNRKDSCGKHKDNFGSYHHEDLIKPDEEDPERYFDFKLDGTIEPRPDLLDSDKHRAMQTLLIFNLHHKNGPLRYMREKEILKNLQTIQELCQLDEFYPPEEWLPLLQEELERIKSLPFATAIKHALTSRIRAADSITRV